MGGSDSDSNDSSDWPGLLGWLQGIAESLGSLAADIASGITDFFKDPLTAIQNGLTTIKNDLTSLPGKIVSGITSFLEDPLSGLLTTLGNIFDSILAIPKAIIDGIRDVLTYLFIPSDGFIQDRWSAIRSRFVFVDSVSVTVDSVLDFFKETAFNEPPKVNIHLNFANSEYNWGGEAVYIDMSWYEPYKPIVDAFLSAWIWITFIFRTWKRLPGIISGTGSDFQVAQDVYESRDYIRWSLSQRRK